MGLVSITVRTQDKIRVIGGLESMELESRTGLQKGGKERIKPSSIYFTVLSTAHTVFTKGFISSHCFLYSGPRS